MTLKHFIGRKVIVRTYSAGVWFGALEEKDGNEVILADARRLWYWGAKDGISLSAVAVHGVIHEKSRIPGSVEKVWLEAIEIIPATDAATASLEGAPHATAE